MVDGDTNGADPSVVDSPRIGDKESVHLKLVVTDDVEGGVVLPLEGVAEKVTFR